MIRRHLLRSAFILTAGASIFNVGAVTLKDYPEKPLNFVVAYTPGSANDILVRIFAPALEAELGKPVIVENKPGAGGTIGTGFAAKAAADGYTLALGSTATIAINRVIFPNAGYDPLTAFKPVIQFASTPNVLIVPASSSVKTVDDLVKASHQRPLNYSSSGSGTTQHLAGVMFEAYLQKGSAQHVPFKGPAEQVTAVAAGQVDFAFASVPSALALIRDQRVRAIGVTPDTPIASLPHVPSLSTQGLKGFDRASVWFGLMVPANTPEPVVARLYEATAKVLTRSDIQERLAKAGYEKSQPNGLNSFSQFVQSEVQFWEKLIKTSGAKVD